jgi:hypothetical protein
MAKATVSALQQLRRPEEVARARGKTIAEILPHKPEPKEVAEPVAAAVPAAAAEPAAEAEAEAPAETEEKPKAKPRRGRKDAS